MKQSANVFGSFLSTVSGAAERPSKQFFDMVSTGSGSASEPDRIPVLLRAIATKPADAVTLSDSTGLSIDAVVETLRDAKLAGLVADSAGVFEVTPLGRKLVD